MPWRHQLAITASEAFAPLSAKLLKNGTLKTYKDFPHGMPTTHADVINADLLAFLRDEAAPADRAPAEAEPVDA